MPLQAAMALSGLNEEQFGLELKPFYQHGVRLLQPMNIPANVRQYNAYNVKSSTQHTEKMDMSISTLRQGSVPFIPNSEVISFSAAKISLRSETAESYWQFLSQLDNVQLEELLPHSQSSTRNRKGTWPPLHVDPEIPTRPQTSTPTPIAPNLESSIIYEARDILDLGFNITPFSGSNFWRFRPAALPQTPQLPHSFVRENISQYSRMCNEFRVPEKVQTCTVSDCNFEIPHYGD